MRGYCGIGIYNCKHEVNLGTLWRSAQSFGADFLYTIGCKYKYQKSDISRASRHIPLFEYNDFDTFYNLIPRGAVLVGVENNSFHPNRHELVNYEHPQQVVYLLGHEIFGIPTECLRHCHQLVYIPGEVTLNVATAGSLILYDRIAKHARKPAVHHVWGDRTKLIREAEGVA